MYVRVEVIFNLLNEVCVMIFINWGKNRIIAEKVASQPINPLLDLLVCDFSRLIYLNQSPLSMNYMRACEIIMLAYTQA